MPSKVLLIDDDLMQHRITGAQFGHFTADTYEMEGALTYEDGLARLLSGDFAACLLDYRLGTRDGLQLLREAVAAGCTTPIIFLTAEDAGRVDVEAMNAGAMDYLLKTELTPGLLERSLRYAVTLGQSMSALRRQATHDPLTGLLNRREFDRCLSEEMDRARRFGNVLGLVMTDFDRFKEINDRHGHPTGDRALREFARRVESCARTVDRVARLGGDEFAVLLVQSDGAAALGVAERICAVMRDSPLLAGVDERLLFTASAGSAAFPADAADAEALLAAADRALYAAKAAGRNRAAGASMP